MSFINQDLARKIYDLSESGILHQSWRIAIVGDWQLTAIQELHAIAENIYGMEVPAESVLPIIFTESGLDQVRRLAKNEYWLYQILRGYAQGVGIHRDPGFALSNAIGNLTKSMQGIAPSRLMGLERYRTDETVCRLTAIGCLLWDAHRNEVVPNPIFYSSHELNG